MIEAVINAAPEAMVVLDEQGKVVLSNPSFIAIAAELAPDKTQETLLHILGEKLDGKLAPLLNNGQGLPVKKLPSIKVDIRRVIFPALAPVLMCRVKMPMAF